MTNRKTLSAAGTVMHAREQIILALAPLAASPLDERAGEGMRRALDNLTSPEVRDALTVIGGGDAPRPPLTIIPSSGAA